MWKKGKRKSEDCEGADAAEGDAPSPKSYKRASDDESDEITVCQVSKNRKVSVKSWQGNIMVSIREYYFKEGKELPTKKGISLSLDQWKILRDHVGEIDKAVAENE